MRICTTLFAVLSTIATVAVAQNAPAPARPEVVEPTAGPYAVEHGPFSYDPSGNIMTIGPNEYVYDLMGRLVKATQQRPDEPGSQSQTYGYDRYGNRTSEGTTAWPVHSATNRLSSASVQYDDAGNLTEWQPPGSATIRKYTYDALGMIAKEEGGGKQVIHLYTADDERLWKFEFSENRSHWTVRDLNGKVLRDYLDKPTAESTNWTLHREYIYRDGLLLATNTPTGIEHYSLDHLGTPRLITDVNKNKLFHHHYWPFGRQWTTAADTADPSTLRFTGHERDGDVAGAGGGGELDYMHARYYSASLARFLSADVILPLEALRSPQLWNRYSYVANTPIMAADPTGQILRFMTDDLANLMRMTKVANSKLHGFELVIGPDGTARLRRTSAQGPESQEQARYRQGLQRVINDPETTLIAVVSDTGAALAGDFHSGVIDIGDIERFGGGEPMSAASVFGHEVMEQYAKQVLGMLTYRRAHSFAIHHENMFSGWTRHPDGQPMRGGSGDVFYSRDGQTIDVRIYYMGKPARDITSVTKRTLP